MACDIAINLEHVCAIFEHCAESAIPIRQISDQKNFRYNWGDLGARYGAPFAALLAIIADEKEVIIPIDAGYMRQFTDQNEAQQERQQCKTVLYTRSMPHNRAHWIMRQILQYCIWPQPPKTAYHIRYSFPTQEHINVMIANHSEFVTWAKQCSIAEQDNYTITRKFRCVRDELFPYVFGNIETSFRNIEEYFRAKHYDSYYMIQVLDIPEKNDVSQEQALMHINTILHELPNLLKLYRIPVKMELIFHWEELWTIKCMRTFKKTATVRHQKRIDREIRMSNYFLEHTVPDLCNAGIMNRDTVANVMRYLSCRSPRPASIHPM